MPRKSYLPAIQVAACLGFFIVQLDVSVVNVGLATLQSAFHADLTGLQWVINSYALVFSALLILGGGCGDRWGARTAFVLGFAIFTLASVGCGLASGMTMLISMRCVQGLGAAFLVPTSLTLIRLSFEDPDKRRAAVAMWGASGGVALAAGPVLGGIMIQHWGWQSIFLVNVPLGLLAIGLIMRFAPPSARVDKKLDALGQLSIATALACLTYSLTEVNAQGWTSGPLSCLAFAGVALLAFALIERKVEYPMLPARLAQNRILTAMMLTGSVINLTFYGAVFILSLYFQTILHYDAFKTGLSFIPLTAVLTLSTMTSARLARRISATRIMTAGLAIQVVGFLMLSQVTPQTSLLALNGALALVGIGSATTVPSMTNSMLSSVSQEDAGIASGLLSSARQLGGVIGVAVFGGLISPHHHGGFVKGMEHAMLVCVAALLICICVNLYFARQHSPRSGLLIK